jgi:hypothetical protein
MRRITPSANGFLLAAALFLASPAHAQFPGRADPQVQVRYARPLGFTDAANNIGPNLPFRGTLTELTRILQFLGRLYLQPGERLDLTVLDLDIAGIQPLGYGVAGGPRIVTDATPPRIRLAYVLHQGSRIVAKGVDDVTDPNFLITQNPKFSSGPLYYERRILTDWFEERFKYRHGLGPAANR